MSAPVIPRHLRESQVAASDPATSIWVAANAGSGKTHVLTQRVIRLLLGGVAPSKLLCLTFTKAAAAEMSERVFKTLANWTALDDATLRRKILETGAPDPTASDMVLARRLFTRTLETPGGLKIQTIHAFCERLLHLFPFEANIPARFEVADEKRTQEMLSLAKQDAIGAALSAGGELGAALSLVADVAGGGIHTIIAAAMRLRARARRADADPQLALSARIGIAPGTSVESVRRAMLEEGIAPARWGEIALVLETGSKRDAEQGARFHAAVAGLAVAMPAAELIKLYLPVFFDTKQEPRSSLMTKGLAAAHPAIKAALDDEQARLVALRPVLMGAETIERTQALVAVVDAIMGRYDSAKIAGGLLDFDDLVERTLTLLERSDARWVLHKLDAGIDHVLVDEAQDTSEAQWRILEHLTEDFATGVGARAPNRSFFVVGDDKQSIFSFQGAAPLMFDAMRANFERRFKAGRKPFARVSLQTSFRSVPGILAAVDRVFANAAHQDGLVHKPDAWPGHESLKLRLPGLVEIWAPFGAAPEPDPRDWSIPLDVADEHDPASIVADRVACKIRALTAADSSDYVHEGRGEQRRAIRPGDILILVRTRNAFFEAVIRALKRHHVPVAGADRLDIAHHIAVMDLVAAGRTALLPSDDLSLACLLKSPLFGLTDEDLMALAPGRKGALIEALAASEAQHHLEAHATIRRWTARASGATPFAFYVELLGRDRGRCLMESRLGPEAHDVIDEFLRLALAFEQQGAPSLGAFLADVEGLESSIKRDMDAAGDAVRVMTVHAAKGLEAKIVFLPDTCSVPGAQLDPPVFDLDKERRGYPLLVWSPRKADDPGVVAVAREAERLATMREYRRLLYVAMTRAEERLYVAGFFNAREPPDDCWSAMLAAAFHDAETAPAFWDREATLLRIVTPGTSEAAPPLPTRRDQGALGLAPGWLFCPLAAPRSVAPLRPARSVATETVTAQRRAALAYGSAVHLLLQHLPAYPPDQRAAIGQSLLVSRGDLLSAADHARVLAEAQGVIALPELAPLFGPQARAEVAVAGRVHEPNGTTREVSGIIDRLVAMPDAVLLADFKSGPPDDDVPDAYRHQILLYQRTLAPLWPGKGFRALLVWTQVPRVVRIDVDEDPLHA